MRAKSVTAAMIDVAGEGFWTQNISRCYGKDLLTPEGMVALVILAREILLIVVSVVYTMQNVRPVDDVLIKYLIIHQPGRSFPSRYFPQSIHIIPVLLLVGMTW